MLIYNIAIFILTIGAKISSLFNQKNKKLVRGHKKSLSTIQNKSIFNESDFVVWIHSASLGEFEQARLLIDKIKKERPESKYIDHSDKGIGTDLARILGYGKPAWSDNPEINHSQDCTHEKTKK